MFHKSKYFILIKTKNILKAMKFTGTTDHAKHSDFMRLLRTFSARFCPIAMCI